MSDTTFDLRVTHPLDDTPEQKLYRPELGRIGMGRAGRVSLFLLRGYLAVMLVLLAVRLVAGL